jgi:hypothetical protein
MVKGEGGKRAREGRTDGKEGKRSYKRTKLNWVVM